jgi:hypothetical protein
MKTIICVTIFVLLFPGLAICQNQHVDISLGKIYFPRPFIHAGKHYNKGTYWMVLTEKDSVPYFKVLTKNHELIFEEMAVLAPYEGKAKKFKYRVKKELLRGYEYFRVKVTRPSGLVMAYFLLEKKEEKKEDKQTDN